MSTRSFIGKTLPNGNVVGIYCHFDGYPEGVGQTLKNSYTDQTKIDALLSLGDISSLGSELGEKHDFDDHELIRSRDWTNAYHRDRGEEFNPNRLYLDLKEMQKYVGSDMGAEWAYIWGTDRWETLEVV